MFIFGQFFASLALLFSMIFKILYLMIVIRILLSWIPIDPYNEVVKAIYAITDPILEPLRRLPLQVGVIDFSPILAFVILTFLDSFVVGVLKRLAVFFGV
ncbi:MAG TPA: YggT family protein [Candidatus Omnitrophota bacterium]|nr:YggT family protein [Candidatus Omnitrophota bacterium]